MSEPVFSFNLRDMPPATTASFSPGKLTPAVAASQVLVSTMCWTLVYCACHFVAGHRKFVFSCLVHGITLLHGLITIVLTLRALLEPPFPFLDSGEENTPSHNLVLVISIGFFIYDFVYLLITKSETVIIVVHHVVGVVVIAGALLTQEGGAEMMLGMFFLEITNPLLQLRTILRLTKYKEGLFYKILEWTFLLLFTLIRVFACGLILVIALADPYSSSHIKLSFTVFYSMSLVMVYYTWLYFIKKYFKKAKSF